MKPSLCGRADLLQALASQRDRDPSSTASLATLFNYRETPETPRQRSAPSAASGTARGQSSVMASSQTGALADVPFWRLETYEALSLEAVAPPPTVVASMQWNGRPKNLPTWTPLAPKRVLLTRLRQAPAMRRMTRDLDVDVIIDYISQGEWFDRIPYREHPAWGSELYLIEDRARRLAPYWRDQEWVGDQLAALYPSHGLTIARLGEGDAQPVARWPRAQWGQAAAPAPGAMVVVLGDLGCLAKEGESLRRFWRDWGVWLRDNQNAVVALVPGPLHMAPPELAQVWTMVRWDMAGTTASGAAEAAVQRLLTLLAPAVRVEPGLLRAMRTWLPEGRGDAGLEARVWQHEAIASQHSEAASWEPERRKAYLDRFAQEPKAVREAALQVIKGWRANLQAAVWFEEVLGLDPDSQESAVVVSDVAEARRFLLAFQQMQEGVAPSVEHLAWLSRVFGRLPGVAGYDPQLRQVWHRLFQLVSAHEADAEAPEWYDPAVISSAGQTVRRLTLLQTADRLLLQPADAPAALRGSPLGAVQTASGEVMIAPGRGEPPQNAFWQSGQPPAWAHRWGQDGFGPWVTFRIGEAEQRLRWMPAGRFVMGSPDAEEGRFEDEGPQREVTMSQGFWLFDTPCTQALWQAVMGDNPSESQGEKRPVETVSWEDCQAFIAKLNEQLPGLELGLPSEAQWEYACRAGTTTARYHDDLDAIAWYDENSGRETHDVGQKQANAWGLYDMLGNVLEWCQDHPDDQLRAYLESRSITEAGAHRVIRGGCWDDPAQYVRAAYRFAFSPGSRVGHLGFRCSSSDRSEPARARGPWGESEQKAEPAETGPRRPAARLLRLQDALRLATAWPEGEGFRVSTDRDRLYVARITKPPWASEIGRDAYGLWTMLDVEGVRQRLRWIPPGRFWMGSPEDDREAFDREQPRHEVLLSRGFWLFDTPCTQALWQAVMGDNPSIFKGENRPVERVSWEDCQNFIARLDQRYAGLDLGLPTEAEWEYACRAGAETPRYADDLDAMAWYSRNSNRSTHDVGQKLANAWGLHDMLGNVYEWCHDDIRTYHRTAAVDPVGSLEAGAPRVFRGGCWVIPARRVRAACRVAGTPDARGGDLGFRCTSSGQASRQVSGEATASGRSGARPEAQPTDAGRRRGRRR